MGIERSPNRPAGANTRPFLKSRDDADFFSRRAIAPTRPIAQGQTEATKEIGIAVGQSGHHLDKRESVTVACGVDAGTSVGSRFATIWWMKIHALRLTDQAAPGRVP